MSTETTITVTGLAETQKKLSALGKKLGTKVIYGALRKGAGIILRDVKSRVPVRTGKLRRGFKVSRSKIHRGRFPGDAIGIYMSLRKGKEAPFYGRFLNDGWQAGKTNVPGLHFIQKSFDANKNKVVRVIIDDAERRIAILAKQEGL